MLCKHVQRFKLTYEHIQLDTCEQVHSTCLSTVSKCRTEQCICSIAKLLNVKRWKAHLVKSAKSNGPYRVLPFSSACSEMPQCRKAIDAGGSIKILLTCIRRTTLMASCGKICSSHTWLDIMNYLLALFTRKRRVIWFPPMPSTLIVGSGDKSVQCVRLWRTQRSKSLYFKKR